MRRTPRLYGDSLLVTAVGLACRIVWLHWPLSTTGDSIEYLETGARLAATGTFSMDGRIPSSWLPPLYPAFIAACSLASRHPVAPLLAIQVVLGALTVTFTYTVAAQSFGGRAALVAGLGLALAPMTARYTTVVLSETIFTFILMAGVWAWTRGRSAACGLAFGLAVLTRTSLLPFVILLAVAGFVPLVRGNRQMYLRIAIVALLTVSPWVIRNAVVVGRVTVADASWGNNLLLGTIALRPGANRYAQTRAAVGELADTPSVASEKATAQLAIARIRAEPVQWIRARLSQYPFLFVDTGDYLPLQANRITFGRAWSEGILSTLLLKLVFLTGNIAFLVLASYGMWMSRSRALELAPLWTVPIYFAAAHLPVFVEPRYGLPLVPFLATFAGAALVDVIPALSMAPRFNPSASALAH
jgi:4-amino-4-deoxy-L-arabinose transferase-like glycosyltransferase